jgi:uncharacterized membrane protein (UPF0127 family)
MRFPVDVVFLSKSLTVVKVVSGLRRNRFAGSLRARSVIELAAGTAATVIGVGDRLAAVERPVAGGSDDAHWGCARPVEGLPSL